MRSSPLIDAINRYYDRVMFDPRSGFLGGHDDFNMGYWSRPDQSLDQSCDELFERLMRLLPDKEGTVLDVGCGKGGNSVRLTRYFPAEAITGINISEKQIDVCRRRAPGLRFEVMDATELGFGDGTFRNVVSVEAAFHFNTRERFLREALRVLGPGGRLVMTDILFCPGGLAGAVVRARKELARARRLLGRDRRAKLGAADVIPTGNTCWSLDGYRGLLERAGFRSIRIEDITERVIGPFSDAGEAELRRLRREGKVGDRRYYTALFMHEYARYTCRPYVIVYAEKWR